MNNRPLLYQGEEFEQLVITPNILLPTPTLEEDPENIGEGNEVAKQVRFLQRSKEHLRNRFMKEYVHALKERPQKSTENAEKIPKIGTVVMLKGETKHKAQWKLGRVMSNVTGKGGTVRGLKLQLGNGYVLECPLQLLCDLEAGEDPEWRLNLEAEVFIPRAHSSRRTKEIAKDQIKDILVQEVENDQNNI